MLFGLSAEVQQGIIREIRAGGAALSPLDVVVRAFAVVADTLFEDRRAAVTRRHAVLAANPELQEREFSKNAVLAEAIAGVLHERGCDPETAFLATGAAMLAQRVAFQKWTQLGETRALRDLLSGAMHSLRTTVGQEPPAGSAKAMSFRPV